MTRSRGLAFALLLVLLPLGAFAEEPKAAAKPHTPAAQAPAPAAQAPNAAAQAPNAAAQAARSDIKGMFGFVPGFLNTLPDAALPGAWEEMKTVQMNPATALPGKIKELIGLGVAAQVPCKYCTYAHTEFAKLNGASNAEIGEAVVIAALTRHWSTFLQGTQTDLAKWKSEVASWVAHAKKAGATPPKPVNVVDAASALQDIQQSFGNVPEFIKKFPAEGLAGAWKEDRDVEMSPTTALPGKYKSLIGLAVASQTPCRYCVIADTEFAKLEGATDREINEAVTMAAITRHWSTWLNGMQTDEKAFNKDVDRLVKAAKKMAVAAAPIAAKPTTAATTAPVAAAAPMTPATTATPATATATAATTAPATPTSAATAKTPAQMPMKPTAPSAAAAKPAPAPTSAPAVPAQH
jgi:AhpD family alkylhydroperoxidase